MALYIRFNPIWVLAAGSIFALILRLLFIGKVPISNDEAFTLYWSGAGWERFWAMLPQENNPPLHFLISRFWVASFGSDHVWARVPSSVFSALSVGLTAWLGWRHLGRFVGVCASLLVLFSQLQAQFAHENRPYALLGLLTLGAIALAVELLRKPDSWPLRIGLVLVLVVLLYLHVMAFFVLLGLALGLAFSKLPYKTLKVFAGCAAASGLFFLPYTWILFHRVTQYSASPTYTEPPAGFESLYNLIWSFSNQPVGAVVVLVVLAGGVFWGIRNGQRPAPLTCIVIGVFLIGWLVVFAVSYQIQIYSERYVFYAQAPFAICVALAIRQWPGKSPVIGASILILIFAITYRGWSTKSKFPHEQLAQHLKTVRTAGEPLWILPGWESWPFAYYSLPQKLSRPDKLDQDLLMERILGIYKLETDANGNWQVVDYTTRLCFKLDSLIEKISVLYYWEVYSQAVKRQAQFKSRLEQTFPYKTEYQDSKLKGLYRFSRIADNSPILK